MPMRFQRHIACTHEQNTHVRITRMQEGSISSAQLHLKADRWAVPLQMNLAPGRTGI